MHSQDYVHFHLKENNTRAGHTRQLLRQSATVLGQKKVGCHIIAKYYVETPFCPISPFTLSRWRIVACRNVNKIVASPALNNAI